jgi:hypothetical protein
VDPVVVVAEQRVQQVELRVVVVRQQLVETAELALTEVAMPAPVAMVQTGHQLTSWEPVLLIMAAVAVVDLT